MIFEVLKLLMGLALFIYGMNVMSIGLEKISKGKPESILAKHAGSNAKGVFLGMIVTAIIQSSSSTTVMVVGLVNSGIMKLSQAVGVIMGANIGTTVTAWGLSLVSIKGNNFFTTVLRPDFFTPIFAIAGLVIFMYSKSVKKRDMSSICIGFALLMFGMMTMVNAAGAIAGQEVFENILVLLTNPFFGIFAGAILTALMHSSTASVATLQAFSMTGSVTYGAAIPLILGQNIGSCITTILSCVGAKKNAKRAAIIHLYFNVIGIILAIAIFYGLNATFEFEFIEKSLSPIMIAVIHTLFNVLSTIVLLPFSKVLEKIAIFTIRDEEEELEEVLLDERFLNTPTFAIEQCKSLINDMSQLSREAIIKSIELVDNFDKQTANDIDNIENKIDKYEDMLGTYLVKISSRELTEDDSREISKLLHCIGDFERITDHAVNIADVAREIEDKKVVFSTQAKKELKVMTEALIEILNITVESFIYEDIELAGKVEPLEQVIDELQIELKKRHIIRLQDGLCTIAHGFVLSDLIANYERVSDHCSNIAVSIIQISMNSFVTHEYLNEVKNSGQPQFLADFDEYRKKYLLPF